MRMVLVTVLGVVRLYESYLLRRGGQSLQMCNCRTPLQTFSHLFIWDAFVKWFDAVEMLASKSVDPPPAHVDSVVDEVYICTCGNSIMELFMGNGVY